MIDHFTGKNTPYTYDSLVISPQKINLRSDIDNEVMTDRKEMKNGPFLRAVPVTMNSETSERLNDFQEFYDTEDSESIEDEESFEDDLHEMIPQLEKDFPQGHLRKVNAQNIKNSKNTKNDNKDALIVNKKKNLRAPSNKEWAVNYVEAEQFHIESVNESIIPISNYLRSSSSRARLNDSDRPLSRHISGEIFYYIVAVMVAVAVFCFWRLWTTRNSSIPSSRKNAKLAVAVTKEMRYNKYEIVSPDSSRVDGTTTRRRTRTNSEVKKRNSPSTNTFLLFSPQPEQ